MALAAVCAQATAAHATCLAWKAPPVRVMPTATTPAPRNTQVRIVWNDDDPPLAAETLLLRSRRSAVKVSRTVLTSGTRTLVILRPEQPLDARARYEVTGASAVGGKARVLGRFKTAATVDQTPPVWAGVAHFALVKEPYSECATETIRAQGVVHEYGAITDDTTPVKQLMIGVWRGDETSFDPGLPPETLVSLESLMIAFGAREFDMPAWSTMRPPVGRTPLVIAPVDLAGRVGAPAFVALEAGRP